MTNLVVLDGVSTEAIEYMDEHIREMERRDYLHQFDSVREGVTYASLHSEVLKTVEIDGQVAAIFGVSGPRLLAEGVIINMPWLALTEDATKHPITILREARKTWPLYTDQYPVLYNWVPVEDEEAHKFLRFLGFDVYTDRVHSLKGAEYYSFKREA